MLKSNKKKGKRVPPAPETADDFLAAAVAEEEAGEKWRAGDAKKSARFFVRAIEIYNAGLQNFPQSFDLAYNKSRIQYALTQQPRLLYELPSSGIELLHTALASHRYALNLKQDDPDILFNAAQVLTTLAETVSEGTKASPPSANGALDFFQEALDLFQRCLEIQELRFSELEQGNLLCAEDPRQPPIDSTQDNVSEEEQWASIIEPVTKHTLLDTALAQIETLTSTCILVASQDTTRLSWLKELGRTVIDKASQYAHETGRHQEICRLRANFTCAYVDAEFRNGCLNLLGYESELNNAFGPEVGLSDSPQSLCDRADAYLTLIGSIYATIDVHTLNPADISQSNGLQWKVLTKALADLTAAAKLPEADSLSKIHLRRGDCELLRYRLGKPPLSYEAACKNSAMLLKNAETCYRGAARLAATEEFKDLEQDAWTREAVASRLSGDGEKLKILSKGNMAKVLSAVEEMRDENLLSDDDLALLNS